MGRTRRPSMLAGALFCLIALQLCHQVLGSLDKLRKYQRQCFEDLHPCVMFMNEESAFGCAQCRSDIRQSVVKEFTQQQKFVAFVEDSDDEPQVLMIPEHLFFVVEALAALQTSNTVAALIVYEGTLDPTPLPFPPLQNELLSTDEKDPNFKYNYYPPGLIADMDNDEEPPLERNTIGQTLKQKMYPFNIFRVNRTVAQIIRARTTANGNSTTSPRYKVQSIGRMYACPEDVEPSASENTESGTESPTVIDIIGSVTSKQCLDEKTCLPIGGQSVWSALGRMDPPEADSEQEILAITAPIDSIAFFPTLALGARAEIASLASLMAVAEAVGEYKREREKNGETLEMKRRPAYFAWNAQSWGYAGSSLFLKDVMKFNCSEEQDATKLNAGCLDPYMESLKFLDLRSAKFTVLNIGQLAPQEDVKAETPQFFFLGGNPKEEEGWEASYIEDALKNQFGNASNITVAESEERSIIPIDASQSFHRYMPNTSVVTLGSYGLNFTNMLYHSMFDNMTEISTDDWNNIYKVTEVIAKSVIEAVFDDPDPKINVNKEVINQTLFCMQEPWEDKNGDSEAPKCDLAREYLRDAYDEISPERVNQGNYPGSFFPAPRLSDTNPTGFAKIFLIQHFLAYHNRYEEGPDCGTIRDCTSFMNEVNERDDPKTQSELHRFFCTRGKCVASVAYRHNAYGSRLEPEDDKQTRFSYSTSEVEETNEPSTRIPLEAVWTESVWDEDLGLCAYFEDTTFFGGLILGAGILLFLVSALVSFFFEREMFKVAQGADDAHVWSSGDPSV